MAMAQRSAGAEQAGRRALMKAGELTEDENRKLHEEIQSLLKEYEGKLGTVAGEEDHRDHGGLIPDLASGLPIRGRVLYASPSSGADPGAWQPGGVAQSVEQLAFNQ